MASNFAWVDFSEEDRQKMLDVVRLFKEQDTRDEIGIGTIRDAYADFFFPGTSTIQTRARYMLFIPWMYQELEQKRIPSAEITARARREEIRLIYRLLESENVQGVIGQDAKRHLQRLPSNIYWSGLGAWGIRLFSGSQDEYHRYLDRYYKYRQLLEYQYREKAEPEMTKENWDPGLPKPPKDFSKRADLKLRRDEAEYLLDRIQNRHRQSLLAYLLTYGEIAEIKEASYFWDLPVVQTGSIPGVLKTEIAHARNFSETIYGAALLYNLLLARAKGSQEYIAHYEERLEEWSAWIQDRWRELQEWYVKIGEFWNTRGLFAANIPDHTKKFVEAWYGIIFNDGVNSLAGNKRAELLIREREFRLKRSRARLENRRALEMWRGAAGAAQVDYRWRVVSTIITDILSGLEEEEAEDA